jgi:epoxyqueuosine reductase QueG
MTTYYDIFSDVLLQAPCCEIRTVSVERLDDQERTFFQDFMPLARTAIVLGHHVTTEEEWTWYSTGNGGERCAADDHAAEVCCTIQEKFDRQGFPTQIVQYPGESGLQFRFVAQSAGMGEIGKNAFLLHPEWGPWIHLRVIASVMPIELEMRYVDSVCSNCGECLSACPAGAIEDDAFDGLTCRSFRKSKGEYTPIGPKQEFRYCKICAHVCPIGSEPQKRNKDVEQDAPADG